MRFGSFMWNGVGFEQSKWKRSNYAADKIEALGNSTFNYEGDVQVETESPRSIRWVDGVVRFETVNSAQREEAQKQLNQLSNQATFAGFSGLGVLGYSIYKMTEGYYKSGTAGVVLSLIGSTWSFIRSYEAVEESKHWNDQMPTVCDERRLGASDFNTLHKMGLQNKIFTNSETQHIFHKTILELEREQKIIGGHPEELEQWTRNFFKKRNPFTQNGLHYAFKTEEVIHNPKEPGNGSWKIKDLELIVDKANTATLKYNFFNKETQRKLNEIQNTTALQQTGIGAIASVVNQSFETDKANQLSSCRDKRDQRHAELEERRWKLDIHEYAKKKKEIDTQFKLETKRIETAEKQNKQTTDLIGTSAHVALSLWKENQMQDVRAKARETVTLDFSQKVSELFKDYNESKNNRPSM